MSEEFRRNRKTRKRYNIGKLRADDAVLCEPVSRGEFPARRATKLPWLQTAAMPDCKSAKPPDYVVGYRRPPKASQFSPGESGNPKGRPKGSRSVGAVLRDVIRQKVVVTEGGKTRRIPALEVMLRRLANDAMRSDPRAMKLLLSLVDRYAESPETAVQLGEVLAEDQSILAHYLQEPAGSDTDSPLSSDDGGDSDGL